MQYFEPTPTKKPTPQRTMPINLIDEDEYDFDNTMPINPNDEDEYDFDNTKFLFSTQCEIETEEQVREFEGLDKSFSDPDSDEDFVLKSQDSSDDIFRCDSSDQDNSDDDLLFDTNVDQPQQAELFNC